MNIDGILVKSFGRRHVLQLTNTTFTEARMFLPVAYTPVQLVSIEEDLPLGADTSVDLTQIEVSGAVLNVSGALLNASAAKTVQQWNLFGEWGLGLSRDDPLPSAQDTTIALLDSGFNDYAGGYDFISDPGLAADGDGRDSDASNVFSATECQPSWHGIQMATIVRGSQALGLCGITVNATMLSGRVLGDCDRGLASDVTDAIGGRGT